MGPFLVIVTLCALGWIPTASASLSLAEQLSFAADMAKRGNWREAEFRWTKALQQAPKDPRILNNLGVAHEVLGNPEKSLEYYRQAEEQSRDTQIRANFARFDRFWRAARPDMDWEEDAVRPVTSKRRGGDKAGKAQEVAVSLPVPPRLELQEDERILVASFLHRESDLLDINRELVRFIRREFRKGTEQKILEINPPPAVPEQTLSVLIENAEFWRYMGREHEADLVVSGVLRYERADASGFQNVDQVSPITGQKIRTNQFVEQEEFLLIVDLIFMDARSGELLFRDRLQRTAIYPGEANDPVTAFYGLGETIVADVLSVVATQTKTGVRQIFFR